jgi:uncharacterized protein YhaN
MRLHRLDIPAFGPFTHLELEFAPRNHDLHVVFGNNEAGKSSLLRAIRDLLFGIHAQSPDNFLHDYKSLRLLGEVTNRAGDRLIFKRRKGNKNTLLDHAGQSLPDDALRPFLGNVELGFFSSMFGLGSSELREGARQILGGDGDIGKALFSASMGGTPVQRVLNALNAESEQLFKGRATANVSIRPSVKRYNDLLRQSRDSVVAADLWERLNRELDDGTLRKISLEEEISRCEVALSWVSRCEDALPCVSLLNEQLRVLGELPELPEVASDFAERARTARDVAGDASRKVAELIAELARDEKRSGECATAPKVLELEDELDRLHQDLGAYRTRKDSLANLQIKLAGLEPSLRSGMESLQIRGDFEVLESLRQGSAVRLALDAAAQALIGSRDRHTASLRKVEELESAIEGFGKELESLPEIAPEPLRAALAVAAEAAEANRTLDATRAAVDRLTREARAEHSLVIGVSPDFDNTAQLPVPVKATLRKFRDCFAELDRDLRSAASKIRDEEANISKLESDLERIERRGELPTEDSLRQAREHRDHGWQLVLRDWKGGGTEERLDPQLPLEAAFPLSIQAADQLADQLRVDADAVAQAEEKRMQILSSRNQIKELQADVDQLESAKAERMISWRQEWATVGLEPRSPDEMEEWRENWVQFRETLGKLRVAEDDLRSRSGLIQRAVDALSAVTTGSGAGSYAVLHEAARKALEQSEEAATRRKFINEQRARLRDELTAVNKKTAVLSVELEAAKADWRTRCQATGFADDTSPEAGLALIQERAELLRKFDHWKECSGEAGEMGARVDDYEKKVSGQASILGVDSETTEGREAALWRLLSAARAAQTAHDQIASQIEDRKGRLEVARMEESNASRVFLELISLAKLSSNEELEPLLASLEKSAAIQERITDYRKTLAGLARGQTVEEFVREVEAEDPDELPRRRNQLESGKLEKKADLDKLKSELNELNRQRDELAKAGDAAADLRQQAESELATVRRDAAQFVRLRLAAHFLNSQIERFREQNQAPLLEKSGKIFQQITRGAFEGLAVEFNGQDIPVLAGARAGGMKVSVEGMSEGTRDQLYLALRLAALDRHLEEHEPMPLILDDLLITFDNDRTKAILPQLAELSKRTQVFLFTHHEHLVDLCRETLGDEAFQLHALNGIKAP